MNPQVVKSIVTGFIQSTSLYHQRMIHSVDASICNSRGYWLPCPPHICCHAWIFLIQELDTKSKGVECKSIATLLQKIFHVYRRFGKETNGVCRCYGNLKTTLTRGSKVGEKMNSEPTCAIASSKMSFFKVKRLPQPSVGRTPKFPPNMKQVRSRAFADVQI